MSLQRIYLVVGLWILLAGEVCLAEFEPLGKLYILRSVAGLPTLQPLNTNELYEDFVEGLQWLAPVDLRRYNIFAANSGFQINRRYRYRKDQKRYSQNQLWKIHETDLRLPGLREFCLKFGYEVWNINQDGVDILIDAKNVGKAKEFIAKTNFTYNIMIDDIETAIDETYKEVNNTETKAKPWMNRAGTLMDWNRYHDYGDIQQFLQFILETYPDIAAIVQIGLTHNKRPLELLKISNGDPDNWAVFIDAGYQARDWLSIASVTYALSKLTWLWSNGNNSLTNIDWYILPVANPDGYQYSRITDRLWTKNRHYDEITGCYGVNLERNFDYSWGQAGSSSNPCKNLYRGSTKFSEMETRSIKNFLLTIQDFLGAYVTVGAYGQAITYPWGDEDFVTRNHKELHFIARQAAKNFRGLNQAEYSVDSSYRFKMSRSGNSMDWVQNTINPPYAYSLFLKDQGRYGYLMPPDYIPESGEEVFSFMLTVAQALNYQL